MSMVCSTVRCKEEYEMIVGTSASCFRRLRRACKVHHTMTRNLVQRDLRHFDNRLGNHRRVELPHEFDHVHLPHLRHRSIHKGLDNLLRRVPLDPPAVAAPQREVTAGRQAHLPHRTSQCAPCLPPWRGGVFWPKALFISLSSPSGPGHALSPWGGVVLTLGQGHCDAQTLVP